MSESRGLPLTTVAIPTYNGGARVLEVIEALLRQDAAVESFELVVVDNNSTDGTADIIRNHMLWAELNRSGVQARIVVEPRQGLAFARICAVQAARGRYVCFLDDDNVPDPHYVRCGTSVLESDERIGILISRLRPRYAVPLTKAMARREHLFAINQGLGEQRIDFGASATIAPTIGGGMWVRRAAFLEHVPWQTPNDMLPDRIGNKLVSGNDIEIGLLIGRAGYRRVYCPELGLEHRISVGRLNSRYFLRLIEGIVRSEITLRHRYGIRKHTLRSTLAAAGGLSIAVVALPSLLLRHDGVRESLYVLASRWATLKGPFQ